MTRRRAVVAAWCLAASLARGAEVAQGPAAIVELSPTEAGLGDPLQMRIVVRVPAGAEVERAPIGPTLGPFEVLSGNWAAGPEADGAGARWIWSGTVAAYTLGEHELPPIEFNVTSAAPPARVASEPVRVTIRGVLPPAAPSEGADPSSGAPPPELADLKPPATIPPDWGPLRAALAALAGCLVAAGLAFWLHRRYAGRFAAVPVTEDPFRRMPPHEWAYEELRRLLERRVAEGEDAAGFYAEISRIVKQYLSGRFRVDLLEKTTEEVPEALRQAGVPREAAQEIRSLLEEADRVKFARESPDATARRRGVDEAYRIVDRTKPVAEQGAA